MSILFTTSYNLKLFELFVIIDVNFVIFYLYGAQNQLVINVNLLYPRVLRG